MEFLKKLDLQLFAEGGEAGGQTGGDGATVVTPADDEQAAQAELEALGVPRHKITDRARKAVAKQKRQMAMTQPQNQAPQAAAEEQAGEAAAVPQADGAAGEEPKTGDAPQRMTWQEIMKDPEYNREMQNLIRARLKGMETLRPALEMLASRYQMDVSDPSKLDEAALSKAILEDDSLWETKAGEMGVEPDVARRLDRLQRFEAQQKAAEARNVQEEALKQHFADLFRQGDELKKMYPHFDLQKEMENPVFRRMVQPGGGADVKTAYRAVHYEELQRAATEAAARQAAEQVAASVQANRSRPVEHGSSGQAPTRTAIDVRNMTPEERAAVRERIKRGEKVVF